jgi:hypothetical protein
MQKQTLLALAILLGASIAVAGCQGGNDADQTNKAHEVEGSLATPVERGAPGNPRGPTDPSR